MAHYNHARFFQVTLAVAIAAGAGIAVAGDLAINEFVASNDSGLKDEDGDRPDWIELFNSSSISNANLDGWYLTDDQGDLRKWRFPATNLPPLGYMIVFASDKDRTNAGAQLHANFQLSASGEYLGLVRPDGTTLEHQYQPAFPAQTRDISYGIKVDRMTYGYFTNPTPGSANAAESFMGALQAPVFSRASCTFTQSFSLVLTVASSNAQIRYTTDRSLPTESSLLYTGAVAVAGTMQVRARAYETSMIPSPVISHSFAKLAADTWGFSSDLPLVFIDNFGIGSIPAEEPKQPAFFAVFDRAAGGRSSLTGACQVASRAGIRRRGESTLRGEGSKPNLGIETWNDGDEGNNDIEPLGMPAENDWILHAPYDFDRSMLHNALMFTISTNIGQYATRYRFVEVFLNYDGGDMNYSQNYSGIYMLEERIKRSADRIDITRLDPEDSVEPAIAGGYILKIDKPDLVEPSFTAGGQSSIYYVYPQATDITVAQSTWIQQHLNQFGTVLNGSGYTNPATGYRAYIEPDVWIDHHLLGVLPMNVDSLRLSTFFYKDRGGKLIMGPIWDFDRALESNDGRDDVYSTWWGPPDSTTYFNDGRAVWWARLFSDPDFWQAWIDRWQYLYEHEFSHTNITSLILGMSNELAEASARNVARWPEVPPRTGANYLDGTWAGEIVHMQWWLTNRMDWINSQFLAPPVLSSQGGLLTTGITLVITAPAANATNYYTLNGADPRAPGGDYSPSATAYQDSLAINGNTIIRVRARDGTAPGGVPPARTPWSSEREAVFLTRIPEFAISEVMYRAGSPTAAEGDAIYSREDFDFIEIQNAGTQTNSLLGITLTDGVSFNFTHGAVTSVPPGGCVVVVENLAAFTNRYPQWTNMLIAGQYAGHLDDNGERIVLMAPGEHVLSSFRYNDDRGWPLAADGAGHSLIPLVMLTQTNGILDYCGNWRQSACLNGSPGSPDPPPVTDIVLNEIMAHTDYTNPAMPEYDSDDWIEIYNAAGTGKTLSNWYLSDSADDLKKWAIPSTNLPAGGRATFDEVSGFHNPLSTGFGLNKAGDQVFLSYLPGNTNNRVADCVAFKGQENSISLGRYPDGTGPWYALAATSNSPNAAPGQRVVISEIMYHAAQITTNGSGENGTNEFVEIHNPLAAPVQLWNASGAWRIDGGANYVFPTNVTMPAGSYLVVVGFDPATNTAALNEFLAEYSLTNGEVAIYGPWSGRLDNNGGRIALERPQAPEFVGEKISWVIVDEAIYSDQGPWPAGADGVGYSLSRSSSPGFGSDAARWAALMPSPGLSPGLIALAAPENGSSYFVPASVNLAAWIDSSKVSGSVQRVEFFDGTTSIATDTNAPYECGISNMATAGSHPLSAVMTDEAGTWTSRVVTIATLVLDNDAGATNVTDSSAVLTGRINGDGMADVYVHWGQADCGTNASTWAHRENLGTLPGGPFTVEIGSLPIGYYFYRCRAENRWGAAWASSSMSFRVSYSNWIHKMRIHFTGYDRARPLTNFPALVTLSTNIPGFSYGQFLSGNWTELRFSDWTESMPLNYEVERWNTGGLSYVWVNVPVLPKSTGSVVMAWGNSGATNPLPCTYNGSAWDGSYAVVLHLDDSGGVAQDSTANSRHAAVSGTVSWVPAQIGNGARMHGTLSDCLSLSASGKIPIGDRWTIGSWFRAVQGTSQRRILAAGEIIDYQVMLQNKSTNLGTYVGAWVPCGAYLNPPTNEWHYIAAVGSGNSTVFYKDGYYIGTSETQSVSDVRYIGNNNTNAQKFAEFLDEFRVAQEARSGDWIWAEWMNQASNAEFITCRVVDQDWDIDGDSMDDEWETVKFGWTNAVKGGALEDYDNDCYLNMEEYVSGSDPTNPADAFLLSILNSNGVPVVRFLGRKSEGTGYGDKLRFYDMQDRTNMAGNGWFDIPGKAGIPGNNSYVVYTNDPGHTTRFFRVKARLQ